ncbi:DKNYY domain-containing protein [Elizabethkingia anophelis]|uniref:Uncharacterized protein n=1 Tax=Elizabethkingia anophelis TaxID=1117645 RepID=A0A7Z7M1Q0_9FLAO|nr:DKNYY domain-containing protein [Elizabethkingia anophelis]STF08858.1 Uncharacterised protein [Elizabethkingia anophelis]
MNADAKSFQVLAEDIAKDKDSVYFRNMTQKLVDRNSFYVDNEIPKDRLHVYYIDQVLGFGIIKGADPKTYELVKDHINWARDKDHYFYADRMINADRNTFAFINDYFLKDKDSVYVSPNIGKFKSILPNSGNVEAINKQYIRIGNTIYFPSFREDSEVVTNSFDKIEKIRGINQDMIGIIITRYYQEAKSLNTIMLMSVPSNCFLLIKKNSAYAYPPYSKDKNNVYYDEEIIPEADVKSFILMDNNFGKDAKNVFYKKQLLKGVDAPSFKKDGDFYKRQTGK